MSMIKRTLLAGVVALTASTSQAAWVATGYVKFDIRMDNGHTHIYPALSNGSLSYVLGGNCLYNRLMLDDDGDQFGSRENGKRIYALLLTAKTQGLRASLGYDDASGPQCKIAQVFVEWPN